MKNTESYFQFKKHDIFTQSWTPERTNDQTESFELFIVHGLGEHSSCYNHMAKYLCENNISCHSFDLIGHGQSSGQRGYISSFDIYVDQMVFVLEKITKQKKDAKVSIFAHSMGGLITLKALLRNSISKDIKIIFSNPLTGINVDIPQWKLSLANGIAQFLPRLSLGNEINNNDLSKDPEVVAKYSQDPLRHKKISSKLFIELNENIDLISAQLKNIKNPSLFLLSPNDKVCDAAASEKLSKSFLSPYIELFPQSGHEIINDLSKTKAFEDVIAFLKGNQ